MDINEAKEIVVDTRRAHAEKYQAVVAIVSSPDVRPDDLLDCLDVGGISAEVAATKLHALTRRKADNGNLRVYLDRQSWEDYLGLHLDDE